MSKNKYNKYSKGMRIVAFICAGLIALSVTVPLWVGR